jgi:hypothetical protein
MLLNMRWGLDDCAADFLVNPKLADFLLKQCKKEKS